MNRRKFLECSVGASLMASGRTLARQSAPVAKPVLTSYTAEDHRRRLTNIRIGERSVRSCMRKCLVTNYMPGHALYDTQNKNWEPDQRDDQALAKFRDAGIGLIQPWSGWADSSWGRNHLVARNPAGFGRFVDLVHKHGMKVIPYTSTNFFERTDPNFREGWAWPKQFDLVEFDYHLAHCSPASPEWRAHLLPRMIRILDEYGVDGLYNDLGYIRPGDQPDYYGPHAPVAEDDVLAFDETPIHDGALEDLLALIYQEVKRRGGIYKLHKEGADTVHTSQKVYDYLWVGEAVRSVDFLREKTKNYEPYVMPQRLINLRPEEEKETFLNSIPYLQFPIMGHGQPGEQGEKYWEAFVHWLGLYLPMVEEGTRAYIDISDSEFFVEPLPRDVVVSAFANRDLYLALANYRRAPVELATAGTFVSVSGGSPTPGKIWKLAPRSLEIVRQHGEAALS